VTPMPDYTIPDSLVARFAADCFSPRLLVSRLAPDDPLLREIDQAIVDIPPEVMEEVLTDPVSKVWLGIDESFADQGGPGRIAFHHLLSWEIYRRRSTALQDRAPRPKPYDHPALVDLEPDGESLVPLSAFEIGTGGGLVRNGYVFSPTLPLGGVSSQSSSSRVLFALAGLEPHIRVDPLLIQPAEKFVPQAFRMFAYGRPLDWQRITGLRSEEFARWLPDEMSMPLDAAFTDVIWSRRSDGIHFECEEVPNVHAMRAARYFHAIYEPETQVIVHADAALRFYSDDELAARGSEHLRRLSKVGVRVKLFRVDGDIDPEVWSGLVAGAFSGNNDVQRYFVGKRNFEDEYSPLLRRNS
jgi:hypothetical protein